MKQKKISKNAAIFVLEMAPAVQLKKIVVSPLVHSFDFQQIYSLLKRCNFWTF